MASCCEDTWTSSNLSAIVRQIKQPLAVDRPDRPRSALVVQDSGCGPGDGPARGFTQHHAQDLVAFDSERHPERELAHPRCTGVRSYSIHTGSREDNCRQSKHAKHHRCQTASRRCRRHDLIHRPHIVHGNMTVESGNRTPNLGHERQRITEQFIGGFGRPVERGSARPASQTTGSQKPLLAIALCISLRSRRAAVSLVRTPPHPLCVESQGGVNMPRHSKKSRPQRAIDRIHGVLKTAESASPVDAVHVSIPSGPAVTMTGSPGDSLNYLFRHFRHVEVIHHGNRLQVIWEIINAGGRSRVVLNLLNPLIASFSSGRTSSRSGSSSTQRSNRCVISLSDVSSTPRAR